MRRRQGLSVLTVVLFIGVVLAGTVLATHSLWRGSSRTLFSVQEHRQLISLARSCLAEAYFELQSSLDHSRADWFDWCTDRQQPLTRSFIPKVCRENAVLMTTNAQFLAYSASDVTIERSMGVDPRGGPDKEQGMLDLKVTVKIVRASPRHEASLTMIERRNFWLADNLGPFGSAGRHVELSPTPAATALVEVP